MLTVKAYKTQLHYYIRAHTKSILKIITLVYKKYYNSLITVDKAIMVTIITTHHNYI